MTIRHTLRIAFGGLATNKTRSALTILGIVIGVTSIILIMSLGEGAQELILSQIQGLGSKTIVVLPGREPSGPTDVAQIFSDSLKERDIEALQNKANVPTLATLMPILFGGESASYLGETYRLTIFGASELITKIFDIYPAEGSFFDDSDVRSRASIVVIGSKVKEELFGDKPAIGEKISIKGRSFRVVGILPQKGQVSFFNFDETAVIPYTTAQQYVFGIRFFHRIVVEATSEKEIPQTVRDIEATLRHSHGIEDPSKDDFFVQTQADLANRLGLVTSIMTSFLASVAAISLLVGGIGIMNIMLVSVTERTREIGLRKAVGATEEHILAQFLLEAVSLTGIGGIIGICLGTLLSFGASLVLTRFVGVDWQFTFPAFAAALGLGVSALVGLIFGIYPARHASRKNPIDALRYE